MSTKIHSSAVPKSGEEAAIWSIWFSPTVAHSGKPSAEKMVHAVPPETGTSPVKRSAGSTPSLGLTLYAQRPGAMWLCAMLCIDV